MATQRFYSAVDKLMNAFIIGSIVHGNSCNCAVGTLCNGDSSWRGMIYPNNIKMYKRGIEHTGYSLIEIFDIEREFEGRKENALGKCGWKVGYLDSENDTDGFKGLCKVFDYLTSIEDWSEEESKINLVEMCLQN